MRAQKTRSAGDQYTHVPIWFHHDKTPRSVILFHCVSKDSRNRPGLEAGQRPSIDDCLWIVEHQIFSDIVPNQLGE